MVNGPYTVTITKDGKEIIEPKPLKRCGDCFYFDGKENCSFNTIKRKGPNLACGDWKKR